MTKKRNEIDIKGILADYQPDYSIFNSDDEKMTRLKRIIFEKLDDSERSIILLYSELASVRKVAKVLGVSSSLTNIIIHNIQDKIYENLY